MSKNKKPIQPTASLSAVLNRMEQRRNGEQTPPYPLQESYARQRTKKEMLYGHKNKERRQEKTEQRQKLVAGINNKIENLYNDMVNFYNQSKDIEKTMAQFEPALNQLDEEFNRIKGHYQAIYPKQKILSRLYKVDPNFIKYFSTNGLKSYLKDSTITPNENNVDYIYETLGEKEILKMEKMVKYFPQLIKYMDTSQAIYAIKKDPSLYDKCNDRTKLEISTKIDAHGNHIILGEILSRNYDFINHLSNQELLIVLKDYPSKFGIACKTYPRTLLKLKPGVFTIIAPSVVFQSISTSDLVEKLKEEEIYTKITRQHPELKEYFDCSLNVAKTNR